MVITTLPDVPSPDLKGDDDLVGLKFRTSAGCEHLITVCSRRLDVALVEALDDAGNPTGKYAVLAPSKLRWSQGGEA